MTSKWGVLVWVVLLSGALSGCGSSPDTKSLDATGTASARDATGTASAVQATKQQQTIASQSTQLATTPGPLQSQSTSVAVVTQPPAPPVVGNTPVPTATPVPPTIASTPTSPPSTATPVPPTVAPQPTVNTLSASGASAQGCNVAPSDLNNLPKSSVDTAPLGQWFHPIFNVQANQQNKNSGQWSWYNTICLLQADGVQFQNFQNNDAFFAARASKTHAVAAFTVMTTQQYRAQFLQGKSVSRVGMNIRALPGTTVEIINPANGQVLATKAVSSGGDLLIELPDEGHVAVRFAIDDPSANYQAQIWFGPEDNPNVNKIDGAQYQWSG